MNVIEKIEALERELAELKATCHTQQKVKEDWWTPLGFDHEPKPGEWVLAWDDYRFKGSCAYKYGFRSQKDGRCEYIIVTGGNYKNIAPFPMSKLGLWVAVDQNGKKYLYPSNPVRNNRGDFDCGSDCIRIRDRSTLDILTKDMTWDDEPMEF